MKAIYIILIVGLFLLLLSMERVQKERTGHRAAALIEDIEFKKARNRYLEYKILQYKAPGKIIPAAQQRGMFIIEPRNIIVLEAGGAGKGKN